MSDPRRLLANARVAHRSLDGTVTADRFSDGTWRQVVAPVAHLFRSPNDRALERQLLFGEPFLVLEDIGAHSFGMSGVNGYVGYVPRADLGALGEASHVVAVARTLLFDAPDLKTPAPLPLSLGSRLDVRRETNGFAEIASGGFVPTGHIRPRAEPETDPVAVAERLLGTPYLWGGNSAFGIDCSGLVQIALNACGRYCPGDSDQQMQVLGDALPEGTPVARGDLLFWKGHVAWVRDAGSLVHANAGAMAVAVEDRQGAIERIKDQGDGPVIAHIRPRTEPLGLCRPG